MRILLLTLMIAIAGCTTSPTAPAIVDDDRLASSGDLQVYRFSYPGSDVHVLEGGDSSQGGQPHGQLFQVSNLGNESLEISIGAIGFEGVGGELLPAGQNRVGLPAADDALLEGRASILLSLEPGQSKAYLVEVDAYANETAALRFVAGDQIVDIHWTVETVDAQKTVNAGDHVRTATVGVWANGTSFYTNIAALNDDPDFPAGYDRSGFGGDPLPIYVYRADRSEQPNASRDTCHFTTITGYNALLIQQVARGTGVSGFPPEDGYTSAGNEDHFLYGEPLAFMNTVVAHDGAAPDSPVDAPDPEGDCFDPNDYTPDPIPDVPPFS